MQRLSVLGITGSIGTQTLDVVSQHPDLFEIRAVSAGHNIEKLQKILTRLKPELVSVREGRDAYRLSQLYSGIRFVFGEEGLKEVASYENSDTVVNALVGFAGLMPTIWAIRAKKRLCLANKESLVVAGEFVRRELEENKVEMLPIDSEHSAILQCLRGNKNRDIKRLLITASGGSFRDKSREELVHVTKEDALKHPNWSMGAKITIDSATMMNKGFEVMEAHWLFDVDYDHIDVLMHRESVIHSLVEFQDGAVMAQLGSPDMRLPIQYALCYPERPELETFDFDLAKIGTLHFAAPDFRRYPLLEIAYQVGRLGGNMPAILNAANEEAVGLFLQDRIAFLDIETIIRDSLSAFPYEKQISLEDCLKYDRLTRERIRKGE